MNPPNAEITALQALDAAAAPRPRRLRVVLWVALVALLLAAQALLVTLTVHYRATRMQDAVEASAAAASGELGQLLGKDLQAMLEIPSGTDQPGAWRARVEQLLAARPELLRFERRDAALKLVDAVDTRARAGPSPADAA